MSHRTSLLTLKGFAYLLFVVNLALGILSLVSCTFRPASSDRLSRAESLSSQNKFDEAIDLYREHMSERIKVKDKPEWENPYFYLLLIGDLQLRKGDAEEAVVSYLEAEREKIDASLISDRLRAVAKSYEDKGELQKAIDFLREYRDRDPLLIDSVLDRLARKIVADSSSPMSPTPSPTP